MADRIEGVSLPRNPKTSPLYGMVEDLFGELEGVWEEPLPKSMASGCS